MESFGEFSTSWPGIVAIAGIIVLGMSPLFIGMTQALSENRVDQSMRILVSLAVLGSSLYVILSGTYEDATQKWAFAAVGTVVGVWFPKSGN